MSGLWWYIPSRVGMIRRLEVCSDKQVEFRFQEAVRVKVFKSILITIFLMFLSYMSLAVAEPYLEVQTASTIVDVIRDKDSYKNASDNEKETVITKELKNRGIDFTVSSKGLEEILKPFLIVILILVYMGWLKKCRLSAIYHVAGIK